MTAAPRDSEDVEALIEEVRNFGDYYELLGVDRDASTQEIQRAFRDLADEIHPDTLRGTADADPETVEAARGLFSAAADASEVLTSEGLREKYDRLGHAAFLHYRKDGRLDEVAGADRVAIESGFDGEVSWPDSDVSSGRGASSASHTASSTSPRATTDGGAAPRREAKAPSASQTTGRELTTDSGESTRDEIYESARERVSISINAPRYVWDQHRAAVFARLLALTGLGLLGTIVWMWSASGQAVPLVTDAPRGSVPSVGQVILGGLVATILVVFVDGVRRDRRLYVGAVGPSESPPQTWRQVGTMAGVVGAGGIIGRATLRSEPATGAGVLATVQSQSPATLSFAPVVSVADIGLPIVGITVIAALTLPLGVSQHSWHSRYIVGARQWPPVVDVLATAVSATVLVGLAIGGDPIVIEYGPRPILSNSRPLASVTGLGLTTAGLAGLVLLSLVQSVASQLRKLG